MTPSDVLRAYAAGRRDFRGVDIDTPAVSSEGFASATLDGADFSGAFIVASFKCASLRRTRFVRANVKTCTFDGANLTDADLSGAALCATTFIDAILEGADFKGASYHSHVMGTGEHPDW